MAKQNARLQSSRTESATILWKTSQASGMMLILISDGDRPSDNYLAVLLELLDRACVMLLGSDILKTSTDTMLQKHLQSCFPIIDFMLSTFRSTLSVSALLGVTDRALRPRNDVLQVGR